MVSTDPEAVPVVRVSTNVVRDAPEPVPDPDPVPVLAPPAPPVAFREAVPEPEAVRTVVNVDPALFVVVMVTAIGVVTGPTTPTVLVNVEPTELVPVVITTVSVPAVVVAVTLASPLVPVYALRMSEHSFLENEA